MKDQKTIANAPSHHATANSAVNEAIGTARGTFEMESLDRPDQKLLLRSFNLSIECQRKVDSAARKGGITVEALCDCQGVRLELSEAPTEINVCSCSWCQRLGALWAYYPRAQVRVTSVTYDTQIYLRAARTLEFHRCYVCGLATRWLNVDPASVLMGVNARLIPKESRLHARVVQGT
jgi:hypothetical protein